MIFLVSAKKSENWQIWSKFLCWHFKQDQNWHAEVRKTLQPSGSKRSGCSWQKMNNKSDSDCIIGIRYRYVHTHTKKGQTPFSMSCHGRQQRFNTMFEKCEKCMSGKFHMISKTMSHDSQQIGEQCTEEYGGIHSVLHSETHFNNK